MKREIILGNQENGVVLYPSEEFCNLPVKEQEKIIEEIKIKKGFAENDLKDFLPR